MAEQIKILFGENTLRGPWNIVLVEGPDPPMASGGGSAFDAAVTKLLRPVDLYYLRSRHMQCAVTWSLHCGACVLVMRTIKIQSVNL